MRDVEFLSIPRQQTRPHVCFCPRDRHFRLLRDYLKNNLNMFLFILLFLVLEERTVQFSHILQEKRKVKRSDKE